MAIISKDLLTQRFANGKPVIESSYYSLIDSSIFLNSPEPQSMSSNVSGKSVTARSVVISSNNDLEATSALFSSTIVDAADSTPTGIETPLVWTKTQSISTSSQISGNIIITSANVILPNDVTKVTIRNANATASVSAVPASAQMRIDNLTSGAAYTISAGTSRSFYMFATARMYASK